MNKHKFLQREYEISKAIEKYNPKAAKLHSDYAYKRFLTTYGSERDSREKAK